MHPYNTARFVQYSKTSVYYNTAYYTNTPYDTSLVGIHTCAHVQIYMHTRPEPAKLCLSASTSPNVCVSNILLAPTHTHIHARAHMPTYTNTHAHTHTHTHTCQHTYTHRYPTWASLPRRVHPSCLGWSTMLWWRPPSLGTAIPRPSPSCRTATL